MVVFYNALLLELTAYLNEAYAVFDKTTALISKYSLRMQMKNRSTKNAYNFLIVELYK